MSKVRYCSPSSSNKSCFNQEQLKELVKQYNKHFPDKIRINSKNLDELLNKRLKNILGNNNHFLWPDYLASLSPNYKLYDIANSSLMPKKPKEWYHNPNTWLTNLDIDAVLEKFSDTPKFNYHFLGTKSIDFAVKNNDNSCSYDSQCRININDIIKNNKKYMGIVLNLDKHNQSGSHWVSIFFSIDPTSKSYGIYFYDSVSGSMPPIVTQYINDIQSQLKTIYKKKPKFYTNNIQHQYGNNECGMFCLCYQIRWLNLLKKNKNTSFDNVIKVKINDKMVNKMRNILFRPYKDISK